MGNDVTSSNINLALLQKLQQIFQMNIEELIDIYISDALKKLASLHKAHKDSHWPHLIAALQDLRYRSVDIGAVQFSHLCLTLEIATQERRVEHLPQQLLILEKKFAQLREELEALKASSPVTA